ERDVLPGDRVEVLGRASLIRALSHDARARLQKNGRTSFRVASSEQKRAQNLDRARSPADTFARPASISQCLHMSYSTDRVRGRTPDRLRCSASAYFRSALFQSAKALPATHSRFSGPNRFES